MAAPLESCTLPSTRVPCARAFHETPSVKIIPRMKCVARKMRNFPADAINTPPPSCDLRRMDGNLRCSENMERHYNVIARISLNLRSMRKAGNHAGLER